MTVLETTADQRAFRSLIPLTAWTVAWVASLAVARFVPDLMGEYQSPAAWIAIGLNLVVGIAWILAHVRYLHRLDELQRKTLMEALAMGLGAGLVGAMAASVANNAGLISFGADAAAFAVVASVVHIVTVIASPVFSV
jgi:hypothetical protein